MTLVTVDAPECSGRTPLVTRRASILRASETTHRSAGGWLLALGWNRHDVGPDRFLVPRLHHRYPRV